MGWRLRKSVPLAPGVRLNMSRRGLGYSVGPRGLKISRGADGRYRRTVSLPGTGLYNTEVISPGKRAMTAPQQPSNESSTVAGGTETASQDVRGPRGGALGWARRHPKTSLASAAVVLLMLASGGGSGEPSATDAVTASAVTNSDSGTEQEAAERLAAQGAAREAAEQAAERLEAEKAARVAAEQAAAQEAARVAAEQAAAQEAARVAAEQAAAAEAARVAADKAAAEQAAREAAAPKPAAAAPAPATATHYQNCTAARQAGAAPVRRGDPGYGKHLDRDNDGVGCEN